MSEENEPSEALVLQRVSEIRRMAVQLQVKLMSNSSDSLSTLRNAIVERTNELLKQMCAPSPDFDLSFEEDSMPAMVSTMTKLRKYLLAFVQSNRVDIEASKSPKGAKRGPRSIKREDRGSVMRTPSKLSAVNGTSSCSSGKNMTTTPSRRRSDVPPHTLGQTLRSTHDSHDGNASVASIEFRESRRSMREASVLETTKTPSDVRRNYSTRGNQTIVLSQSKATIVTTIGNELSSNRVPDAFDVPLSSIKPVVGEKEECTISSSRRIAASMRNDRECAGKTLTFSEPSSPSSVDLNSAYEFRPSMSKSSEKDRDAVVSRARLALEQIKNSFHEDSFADEEGKESGALQTDNVMYSYHDVPSCEEEATSKLGRSPTSQVATPAQPQSMTSSSSLRREEDKFTEDPVDIETRVRLEAMLRLRHFRKQAEKQVESKLERVGSIMQEQLNGLQHDSVGQAVTEFLNDSQEDQQAETSLECLEALATTPLSKLRRPAENDGPDTPCAMPAPPAPATPDTPYAMPPPPAPTSFVPSSENPYFANSIETIYHRNVDALIQQHAPPPAPPSPAFKASPPSRKKLIRKPPVPRSRLPQPKVFTSSRVSSSADGQSRQSQNSARSRVVDDFDSFRSSLYKSGASSGFGEIDHIDDHSFLPGHSVVPDSNEQSLTVSKQLNRSPDFFPKQRPRGVHTNDHEPVRSNAKRDRSESHNRAKDPTTNSSRLNPGDSFVVAKRRVKERLSKQRLGLIEKQREAAQRKERLRQLNERTVRVRQEEIAKRKASKMSKSGYAALSRKSQVEKKQSQDDEKIALARKKTLERLRLKKIAMRKKRLQEEKKAQEYEEKKWRVRDEKIKLFAERREELKRVKAMIAKRSVEAATRPKPQWVGMSNKVPEVVSVAEEERREHRKAEERAARERREHSKEAVIENKNKSKSRKPRPRDLFPKKVEPVQNPVASMEKKVHEKMLATSRALAGEDENIMSFDDVEKWIFEQEEHLSRSRLHDSMNSSLNDSTISEIAVADSPERRGQHSSHRGDAEIEETTENPASNSVPSFQNKNPRATMAQKLNPNTEEEDDAFLEDLLMDSEEGIQGIISPLGKEYHRG